MLLASHPDQNQEGVWQDGVEDGCLGHHCCAVVHAPHHPVVLVAASESLPLLLFALPESQ